MSSQTVNEFISRWSNASPSERANSQLFLSELCDLLGVPRPEATADNGFAFEFPVTQHHPDGSTTAGYIDLYKRACFVLESKQFQTAQAESSQLQLVAQEAGVLQKKKSTRPVRGTGAWDDAMVKARGQAERYVRSLPNAEPTPPFLLVVDVGHSFEVFADFTQAGKAYLHFPDPRSFRIRLEQLADDNIRERLRLIWTNPTALDPARQSADVTLAVSGHLAELAKSLEEAGHKPKAVADFLTRCLFCMFAEDVGLIPEESFTELLKSIPPDGTGFKELLEQLFQELDAGTGQGISLVLRKKLFRFNGGLFADHTALPVNGLQLGLLKEAAAQSWRNVEPAIFGTLLERALNPRERHKLGAHYTPRAYVERLVLPTIVEPLRAEWDSVRAAALTHARAGSLKKARAEVNAFLDHLCQVKILDPACGSGNFLYVSLEHLKRLEGEVLDVAAQFGESFRLELGRTHTVAPHQFLGLEINPRAAAITELVLWIGYLQWHFRTHGRQSMPEEPILKKFQNIECRDAVLAYDGEPQPAKDESGKEITVWDRRSYKTDLLTGRDVPDESKRVSLLTYTNPRPARWPQADYIVGNPPFLGNKRMREHLGSGYTETLRAAYPAVPETADFVMYWWYKSAELVRTGDASRFGLITTNSISQTFSRRVVESELNSASKLSLAFAVPDHPWVDTADGAAVRIAMTVGVGGSQKGELLEVIDEQPESDGSSKVRFKSSGGKIQADLTIGSSAGNAARLKANEGLCYQGMNLVGEGFRADAGEIKALGFKMDALPPIIRPYQKGRELVQGGESGWVIDCFGLNAEQLRERFPTAYQHLLVHVKPERDNNNRDSRRKNWWLFGEPVGKLRTAIRGLKRYIATIETSKYKPFVFIDSSVIPDHKLYAIASDDAFLLGVLSSHIHRTWALAAGGTLEDRPTWTNTTTFSPFPFPACVEQVRARIRSIAENLNAHRKQVQAQHPELTLTGMYNVLEKLRGNEPLTAKEQRIHELGLVSVLSQLHDDLDAAVFAAYGWPATLTDTEILERLVALNAERAKEEASGLIRWLRPEYQNPGGHQSQQSSLPVEAAEAKPVAKKPAKKDRKLSWPPSLSERVKAVTRILSKTTEPLTAEAVAARFTNARRAAVVEILETLCTMGHAHRGKTKGTYLP
jgi:hypothetical protein